MVKLSTVIISLGCLFAAFALTECQAPGQLTGSLLTGLLGRFGNLGSSSIFSNETAKQLRIILTTPLYGNGIINKLTTFGNAFRNLAGSFGSSNGTASSKLNRRFGQGAASSSTTTTLAPASRVVSDDDDDDDNDNKASVVTGSRFSNAGSSSLKADDDDDFDDEKGRDNIQNRLDDGINNAQSAINSIFGTTSSATTGKPTGSATGGYNYERNNAGSTNKPSGSGYSYSVDGRVDNSNGNSKANGGYNYEKNSNTGGGGNGGASNGYNYEKNNGGSANNAGSGSGYSYNVGSRVDNSNGNSKTNGGGSGSGYNYEKNNGGSTNKAGGGSGYSYNVGSRVDNSNGNSKTSGGYNYEKNSNTASGYSYSIGSRVDTTNKPSGSGYSYTTGGRSDAETTTFATFDEDGTTLAIDSRVDSSSRSKATEGYNYQKANNTPRQGGYSYTRQGDADFETRKRNVRGQQARRRSAHPDVNFIFSRTL